MYKIRRPYRNYKDQDLIDLGNKYRTKSDLKNKNTSLHLELIKTKDILSEMGKQKLQQLLVGFALETNNLIEYAAEKVKSKNLDLIIANSAIEKGAGFGTDTNKITIIDKHNKISNFELKSKQEVAIDIVNYLIDLLYKK